MKHWLTDTHWTETVKKSGPVEESTRASRRPVENPATEPHGTTAVPRVIQTSQDFITISDVSSDQYIIILGIFEDGL